MQLSKTGNQVYNRTQLIISSSPLNHLRLDTCFTPLMKPRFYNIQTVIYWYRLNEKNRHMNMHSTTFNNLPLPSH